MQLFIILLSLGLLMFVAYRGFSVILFAPICALLAVVLVDPSHVLPFFSGVFMEKMVGFIKSYFPVFLLGAIFGKVVEMSGIAESIAKTIVRLLGAKRAMLTIVLLGAILTYSGVSLFVAVFAIYPFAAQMFREANIPKRLIPGTIALGAFTFTMDALPGTPQIQNVIPIQFFKTDIYAAPTLGIIGAIFVLTLGLLYLEIRRKKAAKAGEGYYGFEAETAAALDLAESNQKDVTVPDLTTHQSVLKQILAFVPLVLVAVSNKLFITYIPKWYPNGFDFSAIGLKAYTVDVPTVAAIWAIEMALVVGIVTSLAFDWKRVTVNFKEGLNLSIAGALLATMNTGAEYGFGGIISSLPGFAKISDGISSTFTNPLVNGAVTTSSLAGITGSASGGMGIALGAMADKYNQAITAANIPPEVMHRVVAMASGGMDTLPHNGAVITLLAVTGLTHKQSYRDIFAVTVIKTIAVFFVIGLYTLFGII
ncbi:GntP family permease [Bacillus sp. ISL-40]|uniref:GntP family permease n=1 Tax=unclassified Bacillus (in: firmicutes) TaxID=185979 RepID=UPI001BEBB735|nr:MULTISPECIES: GntP family permease [unclassified Bacillus (in: firmicutes)]MBT2699607.1 GntP family permease [Bacillus sp. ISL-40]MBT2724159.1 GntP family permease [Bacillus sp. ISL-46]MBT2741111.1 GntP family permease [Bacillus sp. ISL-77]